MRRTKSIAYGTWSFTLTATNMKLFHSILRGYIVKYEWDEWLKNDSIYRIALKCIQLTIYSF